MTAAARVGDSEPSTSATVCGCSRPRITASASASAAAMGPSTSSGSGGAAIPSKARRAASGPSARAAAVIKLLPERSQPAVLLRLATLESVAPEVLREVAQALASELRTSSMGEARRVDGKAAAIELLRRVPAAQQSEVVSEIEKEDPDLANELRTKLFTFDDLVNLADRDVQTLLREIDTSRLAVALKGAAPAVKDKILRNMSTRAAQMLGDEIAAMGPTRLAAVEEAQNELVKAAFGLAEQGRITIVGPADKML